MIAKPTTKLKPRKVTPIAKLREPVLNLREPVWEQQHYETHKAFSRFALYRDMGADRTFAAVSREVGISEFDSTEHMASKWRWRERALAWDSHLDSIKRKAIEDAAHTMASRQAKLGMLLQDKAIVALENLDVTEATARDVTTLAEAGVRIERQARGEKVDDNQAIVINLPVMPGWAKGSKFITAGDADAAAPPTIDAVVVPDKI